MKNPPDSNDTCYLCGSREQLTRDHIPPKGLFPKPRPTNLETISCCFPCNNGAAKDVEYFRLATSSLMNRNEQGDRAWSRVVESTLKAARIKPLIDELRGGIKPITITTQAGLLLPGTEIPARADVIARVIARLTLGFIRLTHPEVDTQSVDMEVTHIHQFKLNAIEKSGVATVFTPYSLGDGVYRHWRAFSESDTHFGMFVHLFYGAAAWMVMHKRGDGVITLYGAPDWKQRLRPA
jgi:hypothetical protein